MAAIDSRQKRRFVMKRASRSGLSLAWGVLVISVVVYLGVLWIYASINSLWGQGSQLEYFTEHFRDLHLISERIVTNLHWVIGTSTAVLIALHAVALGSSESGDRPGTFSRERLRYYTLMATAPLLILWLMLFAAAWEQREVGFELAVSLPFVVLILIFANYVGQLTVVEPEEERRVLERDREAISKALEQYPVPFRKVWLGVVLTWLSATVALAIVVLWLSAALKLKVAALVIFPILQVIIVGLPVSFFKDRQNASRRRYAEWLWTLARVIHMLYLALIGAALCVADALFGWAFVVCAVIVCVSARWSTRDRSGAMPSFWDAYSGARHSLLTRQVEKLGEQISRLS